MIQEINASKLIEDKINSEQKNKIKKGFHSGAVSNK